MRSRRLGILAVVALVGSSACCGSGSDESAETRAPASSAERAAVAEYKSCVEGAGAKTAKPGEPIPGIGEPSGPEVSGARRALVVYWADTAHFAQVYYAEDQRAAEAAARELGSDARQKGSVVVVPDPDHPPIPDAEGLLLEDCLL